MNGSGSARLGWTGPVHGLREERNDMSPKPSRAERKERLLDILLNRPVRQPPTGWWQDAKGKSHPPGTYVAPPPRPKGPKAIMEARRQRRFGGG